MTPSEVLALVVSAPDLPLLQGTLGSFLGGSFEDLEQLRQAIDALQVPNYLGRNIDVRFDCPTLDRLVGDSELVVGSVDVTATRSFSQYMAFADADHGIDLNTGQISLQAKLTAHLAFQYDLRQASPDLALRFTSAPTLRIDIHSSGSGSIAPFADSIGFAGVTVDGQASLAIGIVVEFVDPDEDGTLTLQELRTTSFTDLVAVRFDAPSDAPFGIDVQLAARSDALLPGVQATIDLQDTDPSNGIAAPTVDLAGFADFRNITPTQVLTGLSTFISSLVAAQNTNDVSLPFLRQHLSDVFKAAGPLADALDRLRIATIVCGLTDTDPPEDNAVDLRDGDRFYCQAIVLGGPLSGIQWSSPTGVVLSGDTNPATVGVNPSANVAFQKVGDGYPNVRLDYADANGVSRSTRNIPLTAQGLLAVLTGMGRLTGSLHYEPSTRALTYRLQTTVGPLSPVAGRLDFGDRLKAGANLAGLTEAGASANITLQNAAVDVTFGIILVADPADITPAEPIAPDDDPMLERFFIQQAGGHTLQADVGVSANVRLNGRIGMLEITAEGDNAAGPNGQAFEIAPATAGQPMFALDIRPMGGIPVQTGGGLTTIPDAIQLVKLIRNLPAHVDAQLNMKMTGGLRVSAALSNVASVTGKLAINWPSVASGLPQITPDGDFLSQLQVFDTDPSIFGRHDGATNAANLHDGATTFTDKLVGRTVRNIRTGAAGVITAVPDVHTIVAALSGGSNDENSWGANDEYEVIGNPLDLLGIILDHLDILLEKLNDLNSTTGGPSLAFLDRKLPLLAKSPKDLLGFLQDVRTALYPIRGGSAPAIIVAQSQALTADDGSGLTPEERRNLVGRRPGDLIECWALTTTDLRAAADVATADVKWFIRNLATGVETQFPGHPTQVGPTTQPAILQLPPIAFDDCCGLNLGKEFAIRLQYIGVDGLNHVAHLPEKPLSLQSLAAALANALGLPEDALSLDLRSLPIRGRTNMNTLVLRLGVAQCTAGYAACAPGAREVSPLETQITLIGTSLPSFVTLNTGASFAVDYSALAQLDLAVPLSTDVNSLGARIVDTSRLELQAHAGAENVSLSAGVGPLMATATGSTKLGARLRLERSSNGTPNDETFTIDEFINGLVATLDGPATEDCGSITVGGTTYPLVGNACASLALDLPGSTDPAIGVRVSNITDSPSAWEVHSTHDLSSIINANLLDWRLLVDAARFLIRQIDGILSGQGVSFSVPLVGKNLEAGAPVRSTLATLDSALATLANQLNAAPDANAVRTAMQNALFSALGPGLIKDFGNPNGNIAADDIRVETVPALPSTPVADLQDVRVAFKIGKGDFGPGPGCQGNCHEGEDINIDLGLPGLPLKLDGKLRAGAGWEVLVDFGISRADGPYIVTGGDGHGCEPEVQIGASVALVKPTPPLGAPGLGEGFPDNLADDYESNPSMLGTVGFLELVARDALGSGVPQPTQVGLRTALDLQANAACAPGPVQRVTLAQLTSGQLGLGLSLDANANVDLLMRTGFIGSATSKLPSVVGTFHLDWSGFHVESDLAKGTRAVGRTAPNIAFENLYLEVKVDQLVRQFVGPLVKQITDAVRPLKPVIDTVRSPIPGVSQLSEAVGGPRIRFIDILRRVNPNLEMLDRVLAIFDFLDNLPVNPGEPFIGLAYPHPGRFVILGDRAMQPPRPPDRAAEIIDPSNIQGATGLLDHIPALRNRTPSSLSFPFLEDSRQIFGMLVGKDVTLIRFDAGEMRVGATVGPFTFPIAGFFSITFDGYIGLQGRFAMGFDTYGIRKAFAEKQLRVAGGADVRDIAIEAIQGIYIDDLNRRGNDVPEIRFTGQIRGAAGLDLFLAAAGVDGGIRLNVDLNLDDRPDRDGKLRFAEVIYRIANPICLFDVSGKLDAFLGVWVRIGWGWFSYTKRKDIVHVTLLDFSRTCDPPNPEPARVQDGNLYVHIGCQANRNKRRIAVNEIHEEVIVRQLDEAGTKFSVTMFGFTKDYSGVTEKVIVFGDDGNDRISLLPGTVRVGSEDVTHNFTKGSEVHGGLGNDRIIAGAGNDFLYGDGGNDFIDGGLGDDHIEGGSGDDTLEGGIGNDDIDGDDGNDTISGGPGRDTIKGGAGNDILKGGPANKDRNGNPIPNHPEFLDLGDTIIGGTGDDSIDGDDGNDTLYGDEEVTDCDGAGAPGGGSDQISGGPGDDFIAGGGGDDLLVGNGGSDTIHGNGGSDRIDGDGSQPRIAANTPETSDGNDTLCGGPGNDTLYGRGGNDTITGGAGNDQLLGDIGDDDLIGGSGNDRLLGEAGNDILVGDQGTIAPGLDHGDRAAVLAGVVRNQTGPGGDDRLVGGDGADFLFGEGGNDVMFGDGEQGEALSAARALNQDYMEGNAGNDIMHGGLDDDLMLGGPGADTMSGDSGQDDLIGGSSIAGTPDGGDVMYGNTGHDVMIGDNGRIERPGGVNAPDGSVIRIVTLLDLGSVNPALGGNDRMFGDAGNDRMFGHNGDDLIRGGTGDDYVEGNPGADTIFGDSGQDDLIGGTSAPSVSDADDTMHGGSEGADLPRDFDVMLGDNGRITRPESGGNWIRRTLDSHTVDVVTRQITLFDVATVGSATDPAAAGNDSMFGNAGFDIMYGQGGDDTMHGGSGDDYLEGNAGGDTMFGDAGNDDMIGGTGLINADPPTGVTGRLDGGDTMDGGPGFDVMAGDNAVLARVLTGGAWHKNTFNDGIQHAPRILLDIDSPNSNVVSGPDIMYGGGDDDLMYGQGGDDRMHGGGGDDFMEGNAHADVMSGDDGQDDMIGGTVQAALTDLGDVMNGNDEDDVMIGDNGTITRPLDGAGRWTRDALNSMSVNRNVVLFDVQTVGHPVSSAFSGGDQMYGDAGDDRMYGQSADDEMRGGAGFDVMEGNHGGDTMFGDGDEDDMVGGGSASNGVIAPDSVGNGLLDGEDEMHGGDDGDVMCGDNARITRPLDASGRWRIDPNSADVIRAIVLFDIERVDAPTVAAVVKGSDRMFGDAGRDVMFGQGNTVTDRDGDGRYSEDPPDAIDNDRDGREGPGSSVYDCRDGIDNDGDGLVDAADPGCANAIDEDGGGDEIHGGSGDDYIEGNHGSDWIFGDDDEDDIIGGNSAGDGVIFGGVPPRNLRDGDDTINGGDEDDVLIGDNGRIRRLVNVSGIWLRHQGGSYDLVQRDVIMEQSPELAGAFGHDFLRGNAGHDDMYGQQGNDVMEGNAGDDAMVGDLGKIINRVEDGSRQLLIETNPPFFKDTIYAAGTMTRQVKLYAFLTGGGTDGNDVMLGGDGRDSMHGGAGKDILNGDGDSVAGEDPDPSTDDEDHLFGGDGDDVMWGGRGHDHLWGGHGNDHLDVRPRVALLVTVPDTPEWFTYGEPDNFQGLDIVHGGWGQDALQANVTIPGPPDADRLIDWDGGYNVFYVCPGAYGEGTITRMGNPDLLLFLQRLALSDGATDPFVTGTSGHRELAYVYPNERGQNSHPPHPDHPGHFVCDPGASSTRSDSLYALPKCLTECPFSPCSEPP